MKIVFFGTPEYVVPVLSELHKAYYSKNESPIVAVVTQAPKPTGRNHFMTYSAVDTWAHKRRIPIFHSPQELLENGSEAKIAILAAYGEMIPDEVIKMFPQGILNIHPSLLPKYRGASPVQGALAAGETITGATIMLVDEKMDHGKIVAQFKEEVLPNDTLETLRTRLFERAITVLIQAIDPYLSGKIKPKEQNHEEATYTTLIKKEYGFIEPKYLQMAIEGKDSTEEFKIPFVKELTKVVNAQNINNLIRSLYPWPGAWTNVTIAGEIKRLKILKSHVEENKLILDEVQLEGKNSVSWLEFFAGYPNYQFI